MSAISFFERRKYLQGFERWTHRRHYTGWRRHRCFRRQTVDPKIRLSLHSHLQDNCSLQTFTYVNLHYRKTCCNGLLVRQNGPPYFQLLRPCCKNTKPLMAVTWLIVKVPTFLKLYLLNTLSQTSTIRWPILTDKWSIIAYNMVPKRNYKSQKQMGSWTG